MKFETHFPTASLKPFIKAYVIVESQEEITNRILPGTSFALAFRFRGQISYLNDKDKTVLPAIAFSGLKKSVRLINYAPCSSAIIVLFKETGVSTWLRHPLHELFEHSVSLEEFIPLSQIALLEEQLTEDKNIASKIEIIEKFLLSKIVYPNPDRLVTEAIAKIYAVRGNIRMKKLANDLCLSQDAFEKRFRKSTGATPKQFSFIVKMNSIIRQNNPNSSFLEIAFENGYYDQSHFNKDFRIFTGQAPGDFFKTSAYW